MDIRNRSALKSRAREILSQTPGHRRLVLIVFGITSAVSLLSSFLSFLLDSQIAQTGGLSGMGLRSILSTVQSVLAMGVNVALPFWTMGYLHSILKLTRREKTGPADLLQGFRRFGSVLGVQLLQTLLFFAIAFVCYYAASVIFSLTPLSVPLMELVTPIASDIDALNALLADPTSQMALLDAMVPLLVILVVLYFAAVIPVTYRLRLTSLCLMDSPAPRAIVAMAQSSRMMKGNCLRLLRLDLSFWWFYLGEVLATLLCYADLLLPMLGIALPLDADTAYFLAYGLGLAAQLVLYWFFRNHLEVTYTLVYESLRPQPEQELPQPPSE